MATIVNDRDLLLQATVPRYISGGASFNTAVVYIYQRSASATPPALPSGACAYNLATGELTGLDNGWSTTFPAGSEKYLYVAMALVSSSGSTAIIPASPEDGSWNAPALLSANGDSGVASYVTLSQPSLVFSRANAASTFSPSTITLTATPFGGTATYTWSYWTGSAWSALTGTSNTYMVDSIDFTGARTFRVTAVIGGVTHTDEVTLAQLTGGTDGIAAITGLLTNPAATLAADNSGYVYNYSAAGGTFKVWSGTIDKTGTAGPVTYATGTLTDCTASIHPSTGVYSVSAMSADSATAVFTATYGGVTIPLVLSLSKARAGAQGPTGTGTPGSQGASYRTAYLASSVSSPSSSPNPQVDSGSTFSPGSGSVTWGLGGSWASSPMTLSAGQYMYQSDGIYDPVAGTTKWSVPYWSSLKVGSLSAISADLGTVTAGTIIGTVFKTSGSSTYVALNEGGNNKLVYYIGGSSACEIGGSSGVIWATSGSSLSSTISGIATGPLNGVTGSAGSGNGVHGISSSGTGVRATGPTAIYADGLITMPSRSPGVNNTTLNSIIASTNNTYQCGYTGNAWQNVYTYGVVNPSDIRIKENIKDLGDGNFGLDFIRRLRPISYTMIVGGNDVEVGPEQMGPWIDGVPPEREVTIIPRKGVRTHLGFPAQNVREALGRGDVAVWSLADKNDPDSGQSVSYIEMVAPTVKAVQQIDQTVIDLVIQVADIQAELQRMKGGGQ